MGGIEPANRVKGFGSLSKLLTKALEKWPEIEFMSSSQLGQVISSTH